ncbi:MAG: LLM class flavin-dependent oxidoreductase [Actinomycetota bacterium]
MRVGVVVMPTDPWAVALDTALRLDRLGFDHLWVYDHMSWQRYRERPWFAPYPWLAGIAGVTSTIRLGTLVANPNLRHAATLAKDAMTLDHISNGRLTLGIGAGGLGFDASVLGQQPLTPGQRVDRLGEYVESIDGLLRGTTTSYAGEYVTIDDARMLPGCVQQPRVPLAVAAGAPRSIGLVARFADGWITLGDTTGAGTPTDEAVAHQSAQLDAELDAVGRPTDSVERILLTGHDGQRPLASFDAFADVVGRAAESGIDEVVVHHPRADDDQWNDDPAILEAIAERREELP